MVTITGPASFPVSESVRSAVATAALERLKQRPAPTEAQAEALVRLEAVRGEMMEAPKKAAAAKVAHLRNKLMAIKLAAGTATATGDLKFARSAIQDIRALAKELTQALKDAGLLRGAGPSVGPEAKDAESRPAGASDEIGQAAEDAKALTKDLRKVVAKLRVALIAAHIRGASSEEVRQVERQLRDTEKDLQALSASLSAKGGGRALDLRT
jgi:hypothetical protein